MAHTPGPWKHEGTCVYALNDDGTNRFTLGVDKGWVIQPGGYNPGKRTSSEEVASNAQLIAAAPDLLSIVQRFVALPGGAWHPERHAADEAELMEKARAAIAKATS